MKKLNKNLSEIFDVQPLEMPTDAPKAKPLMVIEEKNKSVEADFDHARKNLRDLAAKGDLALDTLLQVASASEHPRAYEVAANLIKTLADLNKDLLDIQKKKQDLTGSKPTENKTVIDKAVFVGSTAELVKMIKNQ
jgi:hypothetical protein